MIGAKVGGCRPWQCPLTASRAGSLCRCHGGAWGTMSYQGSLESPAVSSSTWVASSAATRAMTEPSPWLELLWSSDRSAATVGANHFAQNGRCSPYDFPDLLNCHLHTFWTKISTVLWGNSVIITRLWLKVLQEQPRADPSAVLVRITRVPLNTCLELQVSLVDGLIGFINPKKKNKEERKLVYSGRMEPRIHSSATVGRSSLNHV